jgi:urea transport system substrate-binding protein
MRQRWKVFAEIVAAAALLGAGVAYLAGWRPGPVLALLRGAGPPIRLGLLHSQSGTLAISEKSLLDAEILAIDEVNAGGGVGGRRVVWSAPDCRSDPGAFAAQAQALIEKEGAAALFGSWTSECRKALLPVVEGRPGLLFFPGNFEGIEQSPRVVYAGGAANQSILPAVRWAFDTLKSRRFFVLGVEEVWSRTSAEIAKDAARAAGGEVVGEHYLASASSGVDEAVEAIRRAKPDAVLNFLFGDANPTFYAAFRRAGFAADALPVVAFGFSEDEARRFVPGDVAGHYAAWNYFQSVPRPENQEFVRRFRAKYGDARTVGDAMVAAYNAVHFWAQAAREAGTVDAPAVIAALDRQSMDAPDGIVTIDPATRVAWRPFHVARLRPDGQQFEIVWSILRPIRPVAYVGTRPAEEWRAFQAGLRARWGGGWAGGTATPRAGSAANP